ncbi:SGNH/GDSL hydrolase family protein [Nostoc sp.]|uniref:SGNH/GDSL hydrolase family protein n=1 Tax=Nostoc sp. TaxID=1180 RepID=UPI002FF8DF31
MAPLRLATLGFLVFTVSVSQAQPAAATYIALGDSITFGETDLRYIPSFGDTPSESLRERGYVGLYADYLASRNNGVRPTVINLAIDGETSTSFSSGVGRTPPVIGRTDAILAAQNLNYNPNALVPQRDLFLSRVAREKAAGNTIDTVSIALGFNDVAALASLPNPLDQLPATLAAYRANYSDVLALVRQQLPDANLFVLNYYNPFPANPTSPAAPIFAAGGPLLNSVIRDLATEYGGFYVDTATPFVGNEAAYTFQDEQPAGSTVKPPFGGVLPIGNVHPNATGYQVIANQVAAVPEPSSLGAVLVTGAAFLLRASQRRRVGAASQNENRSA